MKKLFFLLLVLVFPACATSNDKPMGSVEAFKFLLEHAPRPESSACGAKAPSWVADEDFPAGAGRLTVTVRWDAECPEPPNDDDKGPKEPALLTPGG